MNVPNLIAIAYDLYSLDDKTGILTPVVDGDDAYELLEAIREMDWVNKVTQVASPLEQADILHEHVTMFILLPVAGHTIRFDDREDSKANPNPNGPVWIEFTIGASVTYPIVPSPADTTLFLVVATANLD